MSEEEEPDGGQDGEDEVGPVVLEGGAVQRRGREEVAEEDQVDHRRHNVHQDLGRGSIRATVPSHKVKTNYHKTVWVNPVLYRTEEIKIMQHIVVNQSILACFSVDINLALKKISFCR